MSEASQFLATILPELAPSGQFGPTECYFAVALGGKFARHIKCYTAADVVEVSNQASDTGLDAYMALASFGSLDGNRKQSNAINVRSVWADIDVGKGGSPYGTQAEAIEAVRQFAERTNLQPSYIVSSGVGLHVYWVFNRNVPVREYEGYARAFKQVCNAYGLAVDPTRATDTASILRVPGTTHRKTGNTVAILERTGVVYEPEAFRGRVKAVCGEAGAENEDKTEREGLHANHVGPVPPDTCGTVIGVGLAEQLGVAPTAPTADAELVARGCRQIATMGFGSYPQWFAAMSVLKRCVNGRAWAHALSMQDKERYDRDDTDRKFDNALPDNPALCSTFESANPAVCDECKYKTRVRTPVQISKIAYRAAIKRVVPAVVGADGISYVQFPEWREYPRIPLRSNRFKVDVRGIVMVTSQKNEDGTWTTDEKVMCSARLYYKYARLKYEDMRPTRQHVFEVESQTGKSMEVWFDINSDYNKYGILRWFANAGVFLTSAEFSEKHLMSLMTTYLENVINTAPEFDCYDRFGWYETQDPDTKTLVPHFVTGSGSISHNGMSHVSFAQGTQEIAQKWFGHKGELDKWKFVPQMYRILGQPIGMLAICLSFAAPLMKYGSGEAQNCILSIYSNDSGRGKTSMLRAAASIWGDPSKQFFTQMESVAARCRRLGILNNLPAFMDEITNATDEELADLSYTLIGGKEKHKLRTSGAEFVKTGDWSTCVFTTSNKSFKAALSKQYGVTDARLLRVMEYECDFKSYKDQPKVMEYINMCMAMRKDNYGLAGPHFMYNLLQKPERLDTATIKAEHWSMQHGFRPEERFMAYPLALAMQAGRWAVEFGLLDYDMNALEQWCIKEFTAHNRAATEEFRTRTVSVLADYLNSRLQSTLVVVDEDRDDSCPDPGVVTAPDPYVVYRPVRELTVRIVRERKLCYFARYDFIKWCEVNGYNYKSIVDDIKKSYEIPVARARVDLGKNVSWLATPRVYCYKIQGDGWLKLGYDIPEETTLKPTIETEVDDEVC